MNRTREYRRLLCKLLLSVGLLAVALDASPVFAAPGNAARQQARTSIAQIRQKIRKLQHLLERQGVRQALADYSAQHSDLLDSDSDGLPDVLENVEGTDSCNSDSDGDGIHDGDEESGGSDPDDADESEVEVEATIGALTETTVTVGNYTFTVSDTTNFVDGNSLADYTVGQLVEAEGQLVGGVLYLRKLKLED